MLRHLSKLISGLFCAIAFLSFQSFAQPTIILNITNSPGRAIPDDFAGLSFESGHQMPNVNGVSGNLFSPTNSQLITLFRNMGLRNLRIGGCTVDGVVGTKGAPLSNQDIDNLFGFARAAGLKVIFSLRLLKGDPDADAITGRYVWGHHREQLDWLAIGNEPDEPNFRYPPFGSGTDPGITNYSSYLAHWRKFAGAVTNAIPGVKFAAPDTGGSKWNTAFANDEKNSGLIGLFTTHDYFGGKWQGQTSDTAASNMLSPRWIKVLYPKELKAQSQVIANGFVYRLTEINDYLRGVTNASNAYASALWALDALHWWSEAKGCVGVNFHNNEWIPTDTVYLDMRDHSFQINPKAYGIKAFDLGSHGRMEPATMTNPENLNLTAYAVTDSTNLYVTLINKEYGPAARNATVTLRLNGFSSGRVAMMRLEAPAGNVKAINGVTLGGAVITNNSPWHGQWTKLGVVEDNQFVVTIPAASAAIVKLVVVSSMQAHAVW